MAVHSAYGLNKYATSVVKSMTEETYTLTFWWNGTGASESWTLAGGGAVIDYEASSSDDKNATIICSQMSVPLLVESLTQQNFLDGLRSSKQEKDFWVTLNKGVSYASGSLIWAGYMIFDLETKEDISYPYVQTLTFIDGISTLKEIPFVRDTNSEDSSVPTYPFTRTDTFDNGGYRRPIGGNLTWLKMLLDRVGMLLDQDDTGGDLENYTIQTSFNWWNEDMDGSPSVADDPLVYMKISMRPFYERDENGFMKVPNCYDVLEQICKNFNMRLIYWNHTFHFIQINEYNTDESGVAPYTTPINIPTREYFYTGSARTQNNFLGNTNYSLYNMVFENVTNPNGGLQKLAGSTFQALPAIKKTTGTYSQNAGINVFSGYPLFVTHNTGSITPTAWPTTGSYSEITQTSNTGGFENTMEITNAKELDGFVCKIYGNFVNTSAADLKMEMAWTILAKPLDSAWGDSDNLTMFRFQGATFAEFRWQSITGEFPLQNPQQYMIDWLWIPANTGQNGVILEMFNSTTTTTTNTTNNLIPIDSSMEGDWEFKFYTFTGYDSTPPSGLTKVGAQGYSAYSNVRYSHGRIVDMNGSTSGLSLGDTPPNYSFDYTDALDNSSPPVLISQFVPVASAAAQFGIASNQTQISQAGNNTFVYDIGEVIYGDGTGANTTSTIQVYNGTSWVFVNPDGKWAQSIYTWNGSAYVYSSVTYDKKIIELLSESILFNQSKPISTISTTTALGVNDKYYSGSTKLKFMNPLAKLKDTDNVEYMMMRCSYNIAGDEWSGDWVQVFRDVPTSVTTSSNQGPSSGFSSTLTTTSSNNTGTTGSPI